MQIIALADIHANLAALETVIDAISRLHPDCVLVAGDIVNRGPQPEACMDLILANSNRQHWHVLKGNHEEFVLNERRTPAERPEWLTQVFQHSTWTCGKIRPYWNDVEALPDQIDLEGPKGQTIRCVHASMRSNRDGLYPRMENEHMEMMTESPADLIIVGHTHLPFTRRLKDRLVVNVGAVGLPFDRDPRASFVILNWNGNGWQTEHVRMNYDRRSTEHAFISSGYLRDGGPMVRLILEELKYARPYLQNWHRGYEKAVARGEISVQDSVHACLMAGTST